MRKHFAAFAASLVKPAAARVGWDARPDDGHLGKLLRATLVNLLALFCWSEPEVLQEARRRFERICLDPGDVEALPTEYKVPVLGMVLKAGGQREFDQVMRLYHEAPSNVEKKQVGRGVASGLAGLLGCLPSLSSRRMGRRVLGAGLECAVLCLVFSDLSPPPPSLCFSCSLSQVYNAIGSTSDPKLKRRVLEWALSEIKLQDFFYPIGSVSASRSVRLLPLMLMMTQYIQQAAARPPSRDLTPRPVCLL